MTDSSTSAPINNRRSNLQRLSIPTLRIVTMSEFEAGSWVPTGTPVGLSEVSRRHYSLATLRSIIATWRGRMRFRWELEQMSKACSHLIDDIGLTRQQAEAEIAKPFWQR